MEHVRFGEKMHVERNCWLPPLTALLSASHPLRSDNKTGVLEQRRQLDRRVQGDFDIASHNSFVKSDKAQPSLTKLGN